MSLACGETARREGGSDGERDGSTVSRGVGVAVASAGASSDDRSPLTIGGDAPRLHPALYVPEPVALGADAGGIAPPNELPRVRGRADAVDWRTIIVRYFPAAEVERAMSVIYGTPNCPNGESGGDPNAYNNGNYGGFQIAYPTHREKLVRVTGADAPALLFDPEVNVRVGYLVWLESGGGTWLPWSCRP